MAPLKQALVLLELPALAGDRQEGYEAEHEAQHYKEGASAPVGRSQGSSPSSVSVARACNAQTK